MKLLRRSFFASSPGLLIATAAWPLHTGRPNFQMHRFTSTVRPITANENRALLRHLRVQIDEMSYDNWFKGMKFESIYGRNINATLPIAFQCNWIANYYLDHVTAACRHVFGEGCDRIGLAERQAVRAEVPEAVLSDSQEQPDLSLPRIVHTFVRRG